MLFSKYSCLPALVVGVLLASGFIGCSKHEEYSSAESASGAKNASPSPEALAPHLFVSGLEARATPTRPEDDDAAESDTEDQQVSITLNADPDSGGAPLTVNLEAEVDGPSGVRYTWDFGDDTSAAGQLKVQHTYQNPGEYTATFTVTGQGIQESDDVSINVAEEGFDVDLDADPDIGSAPLTVQFSATLEDEDLPGPFSFQWDFGDGGRDASNPTTHTYRVPGTYTATLVVTNAAGQISRRDVEIQVDPPEEATSP
jgi:PKD repeat protein